jgi:histidine ammonia-lyase
VNQRKGRYRILWLTSIVMVAFSASCWSDPFDDSNPLILNGEDLTIYEVVNVARFKQKVQVSFEIKQRVAHAHALLMSAAKFDLPIYGLNRGVGLNKDRKIFKGDAIDPEIKEISTQFNKNMIYSHSTGIGSDMAEEVIRATMLVRLNALLRGKSGIQPKAIDLLEDFLNLQIHPVMPSRGSVGEADIAILSHIALAMIGEGEVSFLGKRIPAIEALKTANLVPLQPYAKDALSILSSNAYSLGLAALVTNDASNLLDQMTLIFSMSLEGFNGNVAPFLLQVQNLRPYGKQWRIAEKVRNLLEGSYLWQTNSNRALQDPLSFRTATQVHQAVLDILESIKKQMLLNLNSSDDNPVVIVDIEPETTTTPQELQYYIKDKELKGAIIPTANFEPITWIIDFESLGIALTHVSHNSVQRMIHLVDPEKTGLSRFLAPNITSIAFGTIQKAFMALDTEIRFLANPVSMDFFPLAGGLEDHATNASLVINHVAKSIDNLIYIAAMEEMHAAQAMDLRKQKNPDTHFSNDTNNELKAFRSIVPFLNEDRILQADIEKAYLYLKDKIIYPNSDKVIKKGQA